ncbi:MAG TPA: hypothetical protein VGK94_01125 [Candidatus Polarisedimenticolia bacterium]|jgi:photosystem II stability/assembly factor-like uncharacterized protein
MRKERLNSLLLALLIGVVVIHLAVTMASPAAALDAKVGSDSAAVAVSTSADGTHVYVCDGRRCYASHDGGNTFTHLKVN